MKLPIFSIKHPVITIVINTMLIIVGLLCLKNIGIREYPKVEKLGLNISVSYPNASPELVENSVTNVLEEQLASIEGLDTIASKSRQGKSDITLYFKSGISLDRVMIAARDAVGNAKNNLPTNLPNDPLIERLSESDTMPFMAFLISNTQSNFVDLTHYTNLNIKNVFRSISGVSKVEVLGEQPTIEIKLNPKKMYAFGINPDEIYNIIYKNNQMWSVGKFQGGIPTTLDCSLEKVEDFENLLLKTVKKSPVLLKHVASTSLKGDDQKFRVRVNNSPALIINLSRAIDSNPLTVSQAANEALKELQQNLPSGVTIEKLIDQAEVVQQSIRGIQFTVIEAVFLVLMVIFLFLQSFRLATIPLITIPMSLLGSVIFLQLCGFSINILTLLGMVLAIGLVVDDAIVVLENVNKHIEQGLTPLEAAQKGSSEIGFAIIAMTFTLAAVYLPLAFIQGEIGQLFVEFAVALAGSVLISGFIALTLSPLMCAKIIKNKEHNHFPVINQGINNIISWCYNTTVKVFYNLKLVLVIAGSTLAVILVLFYTLPSEIAPVEDRSLVGVWVPPIPGKDINHTDQQVKAVEDSLKDIPEAKRMITFTGDWGSSIVLPLEEPKKRKRSSVDIVNILHQKVRAIPSIEAWPWSANSGLPGLEFSSNDSDIDLEIQTTDSYKNLFKNMEKLRNFMEEKSIFKDLRHNLKFSTIGYDVSVNKFIQAKAGLSADQVAKAIEIYFSGTQSLFFNKDGLRYPITLKGNKMPWLLDEIYLVNDQKQRVSLGTFAKINPKELPEALEHYNQMRSARLSVTLHNNHDLGAQMKLIKDLARKSLPDTFKLSWSGAAKDYIKTSSEMLLLIITALIFIYAILAIQFENFLDPFIIMLTVPLACAGALITLWLFNQSINIYTQIGLITLIGLITKHGILIVEFTNKQLIQGINLEKAILQSIQARLRPILMTTSAMILGAIPLIISNDTGCEARQAIGLVLVGGLFSGTILTLFVFPTIFWKTKRFFMNESLVHL